MTRPYSPDLRERAVAFVDAGNSCCAAAERFECRRQSRLIRESEPAASRTEDEAWEAASSEAAAHEAG